MSCGMGVIKYLLFIFNFIFAVCGIGILTLGVIVRLKLKDVITNVEDTNILFPSITLIVIGSIIFIISFFGCCGAIRESHCMTITFASFLLFILLIQVAVAVYAFVVVKNNADPNEIRTSYKKIFDGYYLRPENEEIVNTIQATFQCCGNSSPNDFLSMTNHTIPWSCCGKPEGQTCELQNSFETGCAQKIVDALKLAGSILGGVAVGVAAVELIGIIFALCLANSIKNTERRGYRV